MQAQTKSDSAGSKTIDQFCRDHNMSRGTFYNLVKAKKSPRFYKAGMRTLITNAAEADWLKEREADTAKNYEAICKEWTKSHSGASRKGKRSSGSAK